MLGMIIPVFFWCFFVNAQIVNATCEHRHCLAVVDAGSTASRLHLYVYDLDSKNNPVQIEELWSKKIKPGFASIEGNQESINAYLNSLFESLPEENLPVYFYATAGMRLLPHPTQELYYRKLQQWFMAQTRWRLIDAKTITGSEEGVFGWLAVNYQLGLLNRTEKPYVGVMDMGGASVQVTFAAQHIDNIDITHITKI